jgi:hypothetical protein
VTSLSDGGSPAADPSVFRRRIDSDTDQRAVGDSDQRSVGDSDQLAVGDSDSDQRAAGDSDQFSGLRPPGLQQAQACRGRHGVVDCALSAHSHHGSTQQRALLHREDYL